MSNGGDEDGDEDGDGDEDVDFNENDLSQAETSIRYAVQL